jgi:prepilin-type N-terminal cleavage/methylation domain-containing protein
VIKRAFTLIEMLTVLAITAVLLTIIVLPIIQSFNIVRAGEAFADAQDEGRQLSEQIAREIGNAVSVRSTNNAIPTTLNGVTTSLPNSSMIVQVPIQSGLSGNSAYSLNGTTYVDVDMPYTKLDLVPPAQGQNPVSITANSSGPGFSNPVNGMADPTLRAPKGQVATPVLPGQTLVRYCVALRDPTKPYNDPYTGLLMARGGARDNLFVLWRFVAVPYVNGTLYANSALFLPNPSYSNPAKAPPVLDDPRFLVPDMRNTDGTPANTVHNTLMYHWLGQPAPWEPQAESTTPFAHAVIQTQVSRYDMIAPQYNLATRQVAYDGNIPRLTPCVQFRPTIVSNDPTAGQEALRPGEATDNASTIAPDVYKTEYGLWNSAIVRDYPPGYLQTDTNHDQYDVGFVTSTVGMAPGFSVYYYDPALGSELGGAGELFDSYTYNMDLANGVSYPFTSAAMAANGRSTWLNNPAEVGAFTPYNVLTGPGKIIASFDISEVGTTSLPNEPTEDPGRSNLPTVWDPTGYGPYSPNNDPSYNTTTTPATWTGSYLWSPLGSNHLWTPIDPTVTNPYDINEAFNQAWDSYPDLQPNIQRFIDLRALPNEDGTYGPLYPSYPGQAEALSGTVTGFLNQVNGSTISRSRIVPGSETVYGPDQTAGPNQGHPIRYVRVTSNPGPDQYKINYVDQPEPTDPTSGLVTAAAYESALGLTPAETGTFNPASYDPTNFVSATIQPRYKAGYVQLDSDPTLPLVTGYTATGGFVPVPFKVDYRFQFTGSAPVAAGSSAGTSDVFAVEYDTRQLMQVLLTIRNYPQSNLPNPQSITLKATAAIRNYAR